MAIEVIRIEENGRIAQDGRMKVGDQIVEINGLPCHQISFARTRLHLRELASIPEPSLAFQRQIRCEQQNDLDARNSAAIRPIITAFQQGNTSFIGEKRTFMIEKGKDGFGFSFAGRLNAQGEHLYYVKTMKENGPSDRVLLIGDRILEVCLMYF